MKVQLTDKPIRYGTWLAHVIASQYVNGRFALELVIADAPNDDPTVHPGERITTASTNLVDAPCGPCETYIKTWGDNAGVKECLVQAGIIEDLPVGSGHKTGHVIAYRHPLTIATMDKIRAAQYPTSAEYRVRVDIPAGQTAPSASDVMAALLVGSEGAPKDTALAVFQDNADVMQVTEDPRAPLLALLSRCESFLAGFDDCEGADRPDMLDDVRATLKEANRE